MSSPLGWSPRSFTSIPLCSTGSFLPGLLHSSHTLYCLPPNLRGHWTIDIYLFLKFSGSTGQLCWSESFAGMADFTWGKKWKQWQLLFSWSLESLRTANEAAKLKDARFLEEKLLQTSDSILQSRDITSAPWWVHICTHPVNVLIYPLSENESVSCSVISNSLGPHVL